MLHAINIPRGGFDLDQNTSTTPSDVASRIPLFEARSVSKSYGDVKANRDVSLTAYAGEMHALLGENGAGKSTFVKMANGVIRPDTGSFLWNGKPVSLSSPAVAKRIGVGMVFQHFSTFEALTVAENIAVALPQMPLRSIRKNIREISERYGLTVNPNQRVERLSAGEKQRVEIVRVLLQNPKLLILDEPTSVLTPQEADSLFTTLKTLANDGVAIIYISHRLREIQDFCDRATVLRQGQVVGTCDPATTSVSQMAEVMIGKTADPIRRGDAYVGGVRLAVEGLSIKVREGMPIKDVSFNARRGEVMGIAGVAGEGQEALFSALSGERRTPYKRSIMIDGKPAGALGPTARRRLGAAFGPEERMGHAAIPELSLSDNLRLTRHGMARSERSSLRKQSAKIRETYDVRAAAGDPKAGTLSGGNLQKFVIGRELDRDPSVFVVAQPTWGVDAGAAAVIRNELLELTRKGAAVVVISQDLDEIFQIADRVAVLHKGQLSETHLIDTMTPEKIGLLMAGADLTDPTEPPRPPQGTKPKAIAEAPNRQPTTPKEKAATISAPPSPPNVPKTPQPDRPQSFGMSGTVAAQWTPPEQFQSFGAKK